MSFLARRSLPKHNLNVTKFPHSLNWVSWRIRSAPCLWRNSLNHFAGAFERSTSVVNIFSLLRPVRHRIAFAGLRVFTSSEQHFLVGPGDNAQTCSFCPGSIPMGVPIYSMRKNTARPWLVKLAQMPDIYLCVLSFIARGNERLRQNAHGGGCDRLFIYLIYLFIYNFIYVRLCVLFGSHILCVCCFSETMPHRPRRVWRAAGGGWAP